MIALIFVVLGAFFKAVADTLDHHFSISVFKNLNPKFWDLDVSEPKKIFNYPLDAWHIVKSLELGCLLAVPLVYKPEFVWYVDYAIGGAAFIAVFNLFYNKILK
jgi:hypothetical protein